MWSQFLHETLKSPITWEFRLVWNLELRRMNDVYGQCISFHIIRYGGALKVKNE